jgi:hypothetical protein
MLKQLNESEVQELEDRLEFFLLYPQESDQDVRNENYRSLRPVVGLDPKCDILIVQRYPADEAHGYKWRFHFDNGYSDDLPQYYVTHDGRVLSGLDDDTASGIGPSLARGLLRILKDAHVTTYRKLAGIDW